MKKAIAIICAILICFSFVSCGKKKDVNVISRVATNEEGYAYLEVDGLPFNYYGVESRLDAYMNCENKTVEEFKGQFELAKNLGANVITVPIGWRDLEPQEDFYDFTLIGTLLSYAVEYDIKIEFLWYSVNMCGDSSSYYIPDYIWNDSATYPKYGNNQEDRFWNYYGYQSFLKPSKNLLKRETKVIDALMQYVYEWDVTFGEPHPLIGVQVYNEPDTFPRWRISTYGVTDGGKKITTKQAWQSLLTMLDNAGKAFKNAKYNVVTRVNIVNVKEVSSWIKDIYNLEGIDMVGNDPYRDSVGALVDILEEFNKDLKGNFNHFAENKGSYTNSPSLMLATARCGAGYILYDLATPQFFIDNSGNASLETIDHGVLNPDGTDKSTTELVRRTLKGLVGVGDALILAKKENFALFNLNGSNPETECSQTINTSEITISFETTSGAVGYAIVYNGYVYLFSTDTANITLSNAMFKNFTYGKYEDGVWKAESRDVNITNNTITLRNGDICRAKIEVVENKLTSNVEEFIGG